MIWPKLSVSIRLIKRNQSPWNDTVYCLLGSLESSGLAGILLHRLARSCPQLTIVPRLLFAENSWRRWARRLLIAAVHGRRAHLDNRRGVLSILIRSEFPPVFRRNSGYQSTQVAGNIECPLADLYAGVSSCITSQCSTTFPFSKRKMSTAIIVLPAQLE